MTTISRNENLLASKAADSERVSFVDSEAEVTVKDQTNWNWCCCRVPGTTYKSLGEGHYCEVSNCENQAYTFCDHTKGGYLLPIWEGCGKKLCYNHIEHHYD